MDITAEKIDIQNRLNENLINLVIDKKQFSKSKSVKPNFFSFVWLFGNYFSSSTAAPLRFIL